MYIWQQADWPSLTFNAGSLTNLLGQVSREQGRLLGKMETLGFELRGEAHLQTLTEEIVKTSEIEGETLQREQVRSSIARHLGMDAGGMVKVDRDVEGMVEMMLDATGNFGAPLTVERLFAWHASLFPTGRSGMSKIQVGRWRDDSNGPMQVISGPIGRETVHYEAPPASILAAQMDKFLHWFDAPGDTDPLIVSGLAHLWFVTLHPFDDGNGRIARAIADMSLARCEGTPQRFYSMSAQIRRQHKAYYDILETTQKGSLDVTAWLDWFLKCMLQAIVGANTSLSRVLDKARFWERFAKEPLNERQIKVLNKLLDGFEGKLTTSKWAKLAKCSQDTAHRDIMDLINRDAMRKADGGGRSTHYDLILE